MSMKNICEMNQVNINYIVNTLTASSAELIRGKYCLFHSREQCVIRFHVDMASHGPQLRISRHAGKAWSNSHTLSLSLCLPRLHILWSILKAWHSLSTHIIWSAFVFSSHTRSMMIIRPLYCLDLGLCVRLWRGCCLQYFPGNSLSPINVTLAVFIPWVWGF